MRCEALTKKKRPCINGDAMLDKDGKWKCHLHHPARTFRQQVVAKHREHLSCPECGAPMVLKPSKFGQFYGCSRWAETKCPGSHGAHANGAPLGTPANRATKDARIRAHEAFDTLWKSGGMSRKAAYQWMRETMDLTKADAHIGQFTEQQCNDLTLHVHVYLLG